MLADAMAHVLGIESHEAHQRFIAEQQGRQGIHALNPKEGLQPIEQEVLHNRHHLALNRRALDACHQVDTPSSRMKWKKSSNRAPSSSRYTTSTTCSDTAAARPASHHGAPLANTTVLPGFARSFPMSASWSTSLGVQVSLR